MEGTLCIPLNCWSFACRCNHFGHWWDKFTQFDCFLRNVRLGPYDIPLIFFYHWAWLWLLVCLWSCVAILSEILTHIFGLSCLCKQKSLEVQCQRLFKIDSEEVLVALRSIISTGFGEDCHWHDGETYEVVFCPLENSLSLSETCFEIGDGFVVDYN